MSETPDQPSSYNATDKMTKFEKDLEHLINCNSLENGCDTPDFILASYLRGCLENFNRVVKWRSQWYGRGESELGQHLGLDQPLNDPVGVNVGSIEIAPQIVGPIFVEAATINKPTVRRTEIFVAGSWEPCLFMNLAAGNVFRLFDDDTPVSVEKDGNKYYHWECLSPPRVESGVETVDCQIYNAEIPS